MTVPWNLVLFEISDFGIEARHIGAALAGASGLGVKVKEVYTSRTASLRKSVFEAVR
jgi:hypothetical protein